MTTVKLPCYDADGTRADDIEVNVDIFGDKVLYRTLHQMVVGYEKCQRVGTLATKTRGEIAFSNRKPYRQKGTGRARAGTRRSPLWRSGGTTFGPQPRDFRVKLPKQMRAVALDSALRGKMEDGEVAVIARPEMETPKTSPIAKLFGSIEGVTPKRTTCLLVTAAHDDVLYRSARNIAGTHVIELRNLNAHLLLRHARVIFTREALAALLKARADSITEAVETAN